MRLKFKIVVMVMIASLLPVLFQYFLSRYAVNEVDHAVLAQMRETSQQNLKTMALNVYDMCKIADNMIHEDLKSNAVILDKILAESGGMRSSTQEQVEWKAKNQMTGKDVVVRLPKMYIGNEWFGQHFDFSTRSPLVDVISEFTGDDCTILQRMNEQGDMLRIASTVKTSVGSRATGTYIPAVDPNGSQNKMIVAVLSGEKYVGRMQVVDTTYITSYVPIKDQDGKVIGCTFLGVKLSAMESIKKVLSNIKVGKTGYVGVMVGTGENRGTYVISQNGKNDGVNIFEKTDAEGKHFIKDMIAGAIQKKGEVGFQSYLWQNQDESAPRLKTAAFIYFEPWDWVIFPGLYEDDFKSAQLQVTNCLDRQTASSTKVSIALILLSLVFALYVGSKISNPISRITRIAKKIAEGNLCDAGQDIKSFTTSKRQGVILGKDETCELVESFGTMTNMLNSLVAKVQQSTIQLFSTATEIAASSKQQEATVKEFSASTNEIVASSKEISATSKQLLATIVDVKEVSARTAENADSGQSGLGEMQGTMKHLASATDSVSSKLAIINDKANNINDVVATITKVADQTNLLSLNAAIEAEKAGEYGLGFSVVAREIRRLADQTAVATLDIIKMVKEMQSAVSSGVMEMDKFSDEVRHCVSNVDNISGKLENIIQQIQGLPPKFDIVAEGMQGQSEGAQQITEAMIQLNEAAKQTSDSLREFNQVTEQLDKASRSLQQELSIFKVG
jgi:methyl-accepting chemotaxis protein WspA